MKKLVLILAALMVAAPAMAVVNFTASDAGGGKLQIGYTATEGEAIRGVALKVTLSGNATADASATVSVDSAFNTYIDYAFSNLAGYDIGMGHPLAIDGSAGALVSASGTFVVSMGVLDQGGNQAAAPATVANLITIQLTANGDASTNVTVEADTYRGPDSGVVGDGAYTSNLSVSTTVNFAPACWSYNCFMNADSNGDCLINSADVLALVNAWPPKAYAPCADFDKSGVINSADVLALVNHWPPKPGCDSGCVPVAP